MSTLSDAIAAAASAEQVLAAVGPVITTAAPSAGAAVTITAEVIEALTALAKWIEMQASASAAAANAATEASIAAVEAEANAKFGPRP